MGSVCEQSPEPWKVNLGTRADLIAPAFVLAALSDEGYIFPHLLKIRAQTDTHPTYGTKTARQYLILEFLWSLLHENLFAWVDFPLEFEIITAG